MFGGILMFVIFINYLLSKGKCIKAYEFSRLIVLLFSFAFVYSVSSNVQVILLSALLVFVYVGYLILNFKVGKIKWNIMM